MFTTNDPRVFMSVTESRKNLILQVADSTPAAFPFIHQLEGFHRREEIYTWFIRNKITGQKFVDFNMERRGSKLRVYRDVIGRIDRDKVVPIRAGKELFS